MPQHPVSAPFLGDMPISCSVGSLAHLPTLPPTCSLEQLAPVPFQISLLISCSAAQPADLLQASHSALLSYSVGSLQPLISCLAGLSIPALF